MTESPIFHLITSDVWTEQASGVALTESTRGATLEQVGYIHCSFRDQVRSVANAIYADLVDPSNAASELLLIEIDPAHMTAELRVENTEGGDELFPHVYGAIPFDAVVAAHVMTRSADGWTLPAGI